MRFSYIPIEPKRHRCIDCRLIMKVTHVTDIFIEVADIVDYQFKVTDLTDRFLKAKSIA